MHPEERELQEREQQSGQPIQEEVASGLRNLWEAKAQLDEE